MTAPTAAPLTLTGRTVAVTREDGAALTRLLHARGASVLQVPLLRFAAPQDAEGLQTQLRDLRGVAWLLLTSTQAVTALFAALETWRLDAGHLRGVRVAAVGEGTAAALRARGVPVAFQPSEAGARFLAAELPSREGEVALHLTSQLAEGQLGDGLRPRGVHYRRVEAYRTEAAVLSAGQRAALQAVDVVTLASGSAARHLAALKDAALDPLGLRVAVLGAQTARVAHGAGFRSVTVAARPTLEALVDAAQRSLDGAEV